MKRKTYRQRTLELKTVQFALSKNYQPRTQNETAIRHFGFTYPGLGSPDVDVSWHTGQKHASVTVGNTTTDDAHALEILKRRW